MGCIMFGRRSEEVTGEWRKPHDLNDMYCSPNIVQGIKLRGMRWAGHVARMGEKRGVRRVLLGKPEKRDHLEDPCVIGRIILRWNLGIWDVGPWNS